MLGKVMDNCLCLWEHHKMDIDRDGVDLWYGNITHVLGLAQKTGASDFLSQHLYWIVGMST